MTYLHPYTKVTFGGTAASGNEIWACGFSFPILGTYEAGPEQVPVVDEQLIWNDIIETAGEDIADHILDFVGDNDARVPQSTTLDYVKFAAIGTDGKYLWEPVVITKQTEGGMGGGSIPQAALVYTLVADKWRDPGKYNRFYLPTANTQTGTYRLTTAEANAAADRAAEMIKDINTAAEAIRVGPASGLNVSLGSTVHVVSNAGSGYANRAVEVRVGDLIDTQRRRRNALTEVYATESLLGA